MIGPLILVVAFILGTLLLWYFCDMELPVAAVFVFMVEIGINVAGYYLLGWWGGS